MLPDEVGAEREHVLVPSLGPIDDDFLVLYIIMQNSNYILKIFSYCPYYYILVFLIIYYYAVLYIIVCLLQSVLIIKNVCFNSILCTMSLLFSALLVYYARCTYYLAPLPQAFSVRLRRSRRSLFSRSTSSSTCHPAPLPSHVRAATLQLRMHGFSRRGIGVYTRSCLQEQAVVEAWQG